MKARKPQLNPATPTILLSLYKVVDSYGESNRAFRPMQAGLPTSEKTML